MSMVFTKNDNRYCMMVLLRRASADVLACVGRVFGM